MKSFSGSCETDAYVFLISLFRTSTSISTSADITPPQVDLHRTSALWTTGIGVSAVRVARAAARASRGCNPAPHEDARRPTREALIRACFASALFSFRFKGRRRAEVRAEAAR